MCFQRSQTWTGIELQNNRVASHWYISQGAGRNFQNICNQFPNVNLLLMIMSHYPILRIKVKTPCNILHTVTTFCKSNSLPALMTLTDLPELPQLCFLFLLKKKKKQFFLFLICVYVPEKCCVLLLAHSLLYWLVSVLYSMHFKITVDFLLWLCPRLAMCRLLTLHLQFSEMIAILLQDALASQNLCNFTCNVFWFLLLLLH